MADGQMAGAAAAGSDRGTGGAAASGDPAGSADRADPVEPADERERGRERGERGEKGAASAIHAEEELPRPPARPLDAVDRDILRLLRADGRASVRSVAGRVHISRANAYARINRLLDDGVIRGFSARIDQERAGHGASAYITLKIVQNSWRRVRERLLELPGAAHMALVGGDFDVLLLVHTADNRALRDLVLTRIQSIPEVISTRTVLVFEETDLEPEP